MVDHIKTDNKKNKSTKKISMPETSKSQDKDHQTSLTIINLMALKSVLKSSRSQCFTSQNNNEYCEYLNSETVASRQTLRWLRLACRQRRCERTCLLRRDVLPEEGEENLRLMPESAAQLWAKLGSFLPTWISSSVLLSPEAPYPSRTR